MSLTDITGHILEEAQENKGKIIAEARKEIESLIKESQKEKDDLKKRFEKETLNKVTEIEKRAKAEAGRIRNLETEKVRREILDEIFITTRQKIENLETGRYTEFFKYWLKKITPIDQGIIIFPEKRKSESLKIIEELNLSSLNLQPSSEISSGFVFKTDNFEADLTAERIIAGQRELLETIIAEKIFSK